MITGRRSRRYPNIILKYSIAPPTMMPSKFEAKAISAVSLSRNEFVKIMLARNTGVKARTLASTYLRRGLLSSSASGGKSIFKRSTQRATGKTG